MRQKLTGALAKKPAAAMIDCPTSRPINNRPQVANLPHKVLGNQHYWPTVSRECERCTHKCVRNVFALFTRSIMGWSLAHFQCAEIGRLAGETIGYVGQHHTMIHRCRARLKPEIQVLGLVE